MEVVGVVASAITLASACAAASHARKLGRSLRTVLRQTHLIDKDIRSKAIRFRTSGDLIEIACESLQEMQTHQTQSKVLQRITKLDLLKNLDDSCELLRERLVSERARIDRLGQGFSFFGNNFRVLDNIRWEFSLKNSVVSLEPEVNGIQITLGLIVNVTTLELQKLRMGDPQISLEEYERLKSENQRLSRQLQNQESTVRLLSRQNLMVFSALGVGHSGDVSAGQAPHFTIEGLIQLSEAIRQRPVAPRPVAVPEAHNHSQGVPHIGPEVNTHHGASTSRRLSPSAGPSTITTLLAPKPAVNIIKLGPASADGPSTVEISGPGTERTGELPCLACVDKTVDDNFIALRIARAAGWTLHKLAGNDPTMVEYSDGRQQRILWKTPNTMWTDEGGFKITLSYYVCEDMRPDVRLGRRWLRVREAMRKAQ